MADHILNVISIHGSLRKGSYNAALALAAWRSGDAAETRRLARLSLDANPPNSFEWLKAVKALSLVLEAMAHHRLHDDPAARKSFDEATALIEQGMSQFQPNQLPESWHDWLVAEVLRREAEQLLSSRPAIAE